MKGLISFAIVFLISSCLLASPSDTTVTSFEIQLKRKSDNPLGFNTCSIDRMHIYDLVTARLQKKFRNQNFFSLHNPMVFLKFADVCGKENGRHHQVSVAEQKSLSKYNYKYFIKIYGSLDIDKPLNQNEKATFVLRVYIFDANGKLIEKLRSRSVYKNLESLTTRPVYIDNTTGISDTEISQLNEERFFNLVTEAADSLDTGI